MARRVRVIEDYIDDIDGQVIPEGEANTFVYVWEGKAYEIDLGVPNAEAVREMMHTLTSHSRRIGSVPKSLLVAPAERRSGPRALPTAVVDHQTPGTTRAEYDPDSFTQTKRKATAKRREVRVWANENGYEQSYSGQLKQEVIEAWNSAHPDDPVPAWEGKHSK